MYKLIDHKNLYSLLLIVILFACCEPKKTPLLEDPLRITTDASLFMTIPGAEFTFNITVASKMPPAGVIIEYSANGEADNFNYFRGPRLQTSAVRSILEVSSLPRQRICVVNIKVTSKGDSRNFTQISFRVTYK